MCYSIYISSCGNVTGLALFIMFSHGLGLNMEATLLDTYDGDS